MKKRIVSKKTVAKKMTTRKTTRRSSTRSKDLNQAIFLRRIVIISACLVLIVGIAATFNRGAASQAVAGASIARGLFMQATVIIPSVPGATSYNIYYKQSGMQKFTNAVRNIPTSVHAYTISYLKKGVTYQYTIAAVINGREVSFTPVKTLTNLSSM